MHHPTSMIPSGVRTDSPPSPPPVKNEEENLVNVERQAAGGDGNPHDDVSNHVDHEYFDSFPPGYRFFPQDEELILHYLKKKVLGEELPMNKIVEVNLYRHDPDTLAAMYRKCGEENEWYFFTPRDRKYPNGDRPNRAAGNGYWKATGADKRIMWQGEVVGLRKALVYYMGKPPKGVKTNWIMHEFKVVASSVPPRAPRTNKADMRLDDYVLCRIYKKAEKLVINRSIRYRDDPVPVAPSAAPTVIVVPSDAGANDPHVDITNFNNSGHDIIHDSSPPPPPPQSFVHGHYQVSGSATMMQSANFGGHPRHFDLHHQPYGYYGNPGYHGRMILMANDGDDHHNGCDHHGNEMSSIWSDVLGDLVGEAGGELGCGFGSDDSYACF